MEAWAAADWDRLRALEDLGMVLVATCAPDHAREWAGCGSPGKVPIDLATGRHMRDWTARQGTLPGVHLDAFRRIQESRAARRGVLPFGVGVLTGRPLTDGRRLVALDIDGEGGVAAVRRLLGPARAPTLTYCTGSGGWRLLYGATGEVPSRNDDGGHQGIALCADGRQVVLPPSGHVSGRPYRWWGSPLQEIVDLPESLRAWAAERPALSASKHTHTVMPLGPVRPAGDVDRDLRLRGVPDSLRQAVAAPYTGPDRSGHAWALTQRLLGYSVPDALLTEAARVPEWGYGAAYRDPSRGDGWWASTLAQAHAVRAAEVAAHAAPPVVVARRGLAAVGRGEGMER